MNEGAEELAARLPSSNSTRCMCRDFNGEGEDVWDVPRLASAAD